MVGIEDNIGLYGPWPVVTDDIDVYRLLDKPIWIAPNGTVTSLAFKLRPRDGDCLSLGLRGDRSEEQFCLEEPARRNKCVGVAHAKAGHMRAVIVDWPFEFDIHQDDEYHSCLTGLPPSPSSVLTTDELQANIDAEYVGNELAKRVRVIWTKQKV